MNDVRDIDPTTATAMAERGALLLDVREDHEWAAGHIDGSVHLPLGELASALEAGRLTPGREIVAVCRSGNRSGKAAAALAAAGFDVVNLAGGVTGWQQAGLPLQAEDGSPGTVG